MRLLDLKASLMLGVEMRSKIPSVGSLFDLERGL